MENKSSAKKIISVILNTVFYIIIGIILIVSLVVISNKDRNKVSNVLGYGIVPILSDSMEGTKPDSFKKGDLVIVKVLNDKAKDNLVVGDVIIFYSGEYDALIAHRIIEINYETKRVVTRGDKAEVDAERDNRPIHLYDDIPTSFQYVQALKVSVIPKVGGAITYLQTPTGFWIVIVTPTLLFLVYAVVRFIRDLVKAKEEKMLAANAASKEELRQQLLEELRKEAASKDAEENKKE